MPAPKRVNRTVYILVPGKDVVRTSDLFTLGRVACRLALQRDLYPMFPSLLFSAVMTEEEESRELEARCLWLLRRVSSIWLCLREGIQFDPFTHHLLMENEGLFTARRQRKAYYRATRLPVHVVWDGIDGTSIRLLERDEISEILKYHIVDGLLNGSGFNWIQ